VSGPAQLALQTRRAHFELIVVLEARLIVEETGETAGELGETVEIDATLAINCHPEHPPPPMAGQLEIVQLESLGGEIRLHHTPNVSQLCQFLRWSFDVYTTNRWVPKGAHLTEKRPYLVRRL